MTRSYQFIVFIQVCALIGVLSLCNYPTTRLQQPLLTKQLMSTARLTRLQAATHSATHDNIESSTTDPLLLRAARGEIVERVPVWMMRQAGRHMKAYRDLCVKHKTFRERSENAELATEISLQPFRSYGVDGCILFSDILTPLPGMGINFDILEHQGPKMAPIRSVEAVNAIHSLDPTTATPFVAETLANLRKEVGPTTTVLGFVGAPFTLASYVIEGGSSADYRETKKMAFTNPDLLHNLLDRLCDNIATYASFQIQSGAQVVQIFDSWASCLSPAEFSEFSKKYLKKMIEKIKSKHRDVPIILFISKSSALIEDMADTGADIISLDWTVHTSDAWARIKAKNPNAKGIQGNLDPMILHGNDSLIKQRTESILRSMNGRNHVMNLGHGIDEKTSEEKAKYFVNVVKHWRK